MVEMDAIIAGYVAPMSRTATSLKTKAVADAFALLIPKDEEYVDSTIAIENLEFASFAVGGLAAAVQTPPTGVRAESIVNLPLADAAGRADPLQQRTVQQRIVLYGPGDVRGIDAGQIVRRYPAPGTPDAEETTLAHIEFDRPELPWAFSASTPHAHMQPWLALIVVDRSAVRWLPGAVPMIEVPRDQLPSLSRSYQWAHAQAAGAQTSGGAPVSLATRLSSAYAPANLSRLVSPRVMQPDTDYLAALVPTTDVGVRSLRGGVGGTLGPAWPDGGDASVVLPVFDSWEFRTGEEGDFQTLALKIDGVVAPYQVGRRFIDVREPGRPLTSLAAGEPGGRQVLRCALVSPTPPPPEFEAVENASWPQSKLDELTSQVNLPARLEAEQEPGPDGIPLIPVIGPRIYAKLQRGAAVVDGSDWFSELNLAPMNRLVGGLGTRVVQRDQEQLMQAAWAQLGEVLKANRAIMLAQLAELIATRIHDRLSGLEPGRLLQIAGPAAPHISRRAGVTLAGEMAASATPTAVLGGAFRRVLRPSGPVLRRTDAATRVGVGVLVGAGDTSRDFTRQYVNPDGVAGLSKAAMTLLDATRVGAALGVPVAGVADLLTRSAGERDGGVFSKLVHPSTWQAPNVDFDAAVITAQRWSDVLLRDAGDAAIDAVRAERSGPLMAELARSSATHDLPVRTQLEDQATKLNNAVLTKLGGGRDFEIEREHGRDPRDGGPRTRGRAGGGIFDELRPHLGDFRRHGGIADAMRSNPLGTAISRTPLVGARGVAVTARRAATGIRGVNMLDVSSLTRVGDDTPRDKRDAALDAFRDLAARPISGVLDRVAGLPASALRDVMTRVIDPSGALSLPIVPRRATVGTVDLAATLRPGPAIRDALRGRLRLRDDLVDRVFHPERLRRVMAGPVFRRPMYRALHDYDPDWLLPGLGLLPATDFVTVLETNSVFTEAFLIGLSDEFGRELLWRGYPTDQAFTYFLRFWDDQQDEMPRMIHEFARTPLGEHLAIGGDGGTRPRAVIVVKSELVRRYPDLIIQATKSWGPPDAPQFDGAQAEVARQLFEAHLEPDVSLIGIDLTVDELDGPDWWITIAEHPTATRFETQPTGAGRFVEPALQQTATQFLKERLHHPTRVAFRATDLIVRQ